MAHREHSVRKRTGLPACAAVFSAILLAGSPQAAPVTGPDESTMDTPGGTVRVTHAPFALSFLQNGGAAVLTTTPASGASPEPVAAMDPEFLNSDTLPDRLLCDAISYEVGGAANPQFPGGPWVGHIVTGMHGGMQFTATAVRDVTVAGDGLNLLLATNDPTGREISLRLRPDAEHTLRAEVQVVPDLGVSGVAVCFEKNADESFHGFGGRHNAIDQNGNDFLNYIQAQSVGGGPAYQGALVTQGEEKAETYMFPGGAASAYYIHSHFTSTAGYGFFLDRFELTGFRFGEFGADRWQAWAAGAQIDFMVAPGDVQTAVRKLSAINGRHRAPADVAHLGPVLSRAIRVLGPEADDAQTYAAKVEADLARILDPERDFPVRGYAFEAWEIMDRGQVRSVIERLHAAGIRAYLYNRNYVGLDPANTERPETFNEAVGKGYVARTAAGTPYFIGSTFLGLGAVIDFTNPAARAWWQDRIREMIELGADGFMQDFGENVQADMHFHDGSTGATMHNRYPNLFHQATREVLEEYEATDPDAREIFFWTRGGYSGRDGQGSAGFENSNFPGDETTDWSRSSGLASVATDMLSRAVGGSYGFNTDIGGYWDYHVPPADAELYVRWAQWAALSPVFRVHNSSSTGVQMPWFHGEDTLALWAAAARLHVEAAPLIQHLWQLAAETGMPPTRPLWLQYPEDPRARGEDQQWLLGENILVAPVVEQGAVTRRVYFPAGTWRAPFDGQVYVGPGEIEVSAPLERLPWFVRCESPGAGAAVVCPKDPFRVPAADASGRPEEARQ